MSNVYQNMILLLFTSIIIIVTWYIDKELSALHANIKIIQNMLKVTLSNQNIMISEQSVNECCVRGDTGIYNKFNECNQAMQTIIEEEIESITNELAPEGITNELAPEGITNELAPEGITNELAPELSDECITNELAHDGIITNELAPELSDECVTNELAHEGIITNELVPELPDECITMVTAETIPPLGVQQKKKRQYRKKAGVEITV